MPTAQRMCVRSERISTSGRSWFRRSRRWCDRQVESALRPHLTDPGIVSYSHEPSLLSSSDAGRTPVDRCHPGARGAYVATGHSVWGILNAPATGEAVAELILDGATRAVDLSSFDAARLEAVEPGRVTVIRRRLG